ncbi:MAG: sugar transferase [Chloroflexi bacterium]|nr:sugar transferase [Chloroflexota bacterium]
MAKRTFDLMASIIGLIIFSPILLVTAFVILITLGLPILYSPTRAGRFNKPFIVRKFRSMRIADGPTSHHSGDDDPRVTTVGRWMRKFKIDELPQLWNVVKGEMSLVGPRPETPDYIKHYSPEQHVILDVRPGITDYASIEFRDLGTLLEGDDPDKLYFAKVWDRKMELRMKYVQERTFWVDLKLISLTLTAIVRRPN